MEVGLYGKLPTHGDFLRRRVADDFVAVWDDWLQQCIAQSRATLGESWLETYLTSPVWRFSLAPGACGAAAVAGVLAPSVDRVGRYFPLTIVWAAPAQLSTFDVALRHERGFDRAERLVLDTLAADQIEFTDFDRHVMELAGEFERMTPLGELRLQRSSLVSLAADPAHPRCLPLQSVNALAAPALQLLGCQLDSGTAPVGIWWTDGSAAISPSWLITPGLPPPARYAAMLDGAWTAAGWAVAEAESEPDGTATTVPADPDPPGVAALSAGLSDRGPVRNTNQDAFIERPDLNLWAVADGLGGLSGGDVASRMVCDALAEGRLAPTLDEQIDVAVGQLHLVNRHLRRIATRPVSPVLSASTAVVLLLHGKECAVIWAGDSRAYRLRDGQLSQLTTDHSWAVELRTTAAAAGEDAEAVTRAVGAEEELEPEIVRSEVHPNDRYLLCSDGVGRVLDLPRLTRILQAGDPATACAELLKQSFAAGGTDNATAVVVDCRVPAS